MKTRKRRPRRKTKRGGLAGEMYMAAGMIALLNTVMITMGPTFQSYSCKDSDANNTQNI